MNRYVYLPRLKSRSVLVEAVRSAVKDLVPGPFAFADRSNEAEGRYAGLAVQNAAAAAIVLGGDAVLVQAKAAARGSAASPDPAGAPAGPAYPTATGTATGGAEVPRPYVPPADVLPTRFFGTVMIDPLRPAQEVRQIIEAVVEQLTTIKGASVDLKLEIVAEVPSGLDRSRTRTLLENATTLRFIEKSVR